jgi:hypothetical protein
MQEEARNGTLLQNEVLTSFIFAALPILLAHCALITMPAMAMSIVGGLLIYGTIISFTQFFKEEQDF